MKKISLKNLNLQEVEQLSREQLKNVLGGFSGSGDDDSGSGGPNTSCTCSDGRFCGISGSFPDACAKINACVVTCCGGERVAC